MDFLVLGTLEVWRNGERVALPSLRHQRVLAALLTAPNAVVPLPKLIEALWEEDPPATATKQVRNCVLALRKRMGAPAKELIITDGPGYRLVVAEDRIDALRFRSGMIAARRLAVDGLVAEAVAQARSVLRLWRGPALDGLATSILAGRAARLDEQRLVAIEKCVDWQLALGEHREVTDELTELVVEHPLRERTHGQLMTALACGGRQTDALAVFHGLRARLAEELGIDPGAGTRDLHERILRGEIERPAPLALDSTVDIAGDGPPDSLGGSGLDRAVRDLATAMTHQWRTEAEMRSLHRPAPVRIMWSSTRRRVTAAVKPNGEAGGAFRGELADVVAAFRQTPSRQLVVLGEPGAGKSVLAIQLTLGLLADPEPGEPIPVLMPLASWDPHREHLHVWLARKLVEEYPGLANTAAYGRDAASRLVVEGA
jgi:DNA-binding SARP family transcriptional activator